MNKKINKIIKDIKVNNSKKNFPQVYFDDYNNTLEIFFF